MAFQHPKTYKAYAFLEKGGNLQKIEVEWKDPKPGGVVVKVLACGVCASDRTVQDVWAFATLPRVPGHEIVGDVVAVAEGEKLWKLGDRVGAGWHGGQCHSCDRCLVGDFVTCAVSAQANGVTRDGGYAEYATVRSEALASIPRDMDPAEAAPLLCAGVTTFNALRHMTPTPPDIVAIQGIGGLGHLAIQFARQMGFRTVALSTSDSKKELAKKLGAHEFISGTPQEQAAALQALGGARCIMCTAPDDKGTQELIHGLTYDGELVLLALSTGTVTLPISAIIAKRLKVCGWPYGTGKDCEDTANFSKAQGVVTMVQRVPLDKAQDAYDHRATARFRAVITP